MTESQDQSSRNANEHQGVRDPAHMSLRSRDMGLQTNDGEKEANTEFRDAEVALYAIIFWGCAGLMASVGLGTYLGHLGQSMPKFALAGAAVGACIGFYAGIGETNFAKGLSLPGVLLGIIGTFCRLH